MAGVWYFAYGSNMDSATFRGRRGIEARRALAARAAGWGLVFDKPPLIPIGESFANLVPTPGAEVFGVLYDITEADLAHLDMTEGVLIGNYQRIAIAVRPLAEELGEVTAFTLVCEQRDPTLHPSDRYMACLIAGAEEHGLPAAHVALLRAVPTVPASSEATAWRPVFDEVMRRPAPETKP